jgi:hypothetical protein
MTATRENRSGFPIDDGEGSEDPEPDDSSTIGSRANRPELLSRLDLAPLVAVPPPEQEAATRGVSLRWMGQERDRHAAGVMRMPRDVENPMTCGRSIRCTRLPRLEWGTWRLALGPAQRNARQQSAAHEERVASVGRNSDPVDRERRDPPTLPRTAAVEIDDADFVVGTRRHHASMDRIEGDSVNGSRVGEDRAADALRVEVPDLKPALTVTGQSLTRFRTEGDCGDRCRVRLQRRDGAVRFEVDQVRAPRSGAGSKDAFADGIERET